MTEGKKRLYKMGPEKEEFHWRKVMRVGGSVVVPLPRELRQKLGIGVGDYVKVKEGPDETIIIEQERRPWDGIIKRKD
ncbi:hypothetical protein ES708_12445 [subsurface metagenome]